MNPEESDDSVHCIHCGNYIGDGDAGWPRKCACGEFNYNSPKPVVALVLFAWDEAHQHLGAIVVKRGITPHKGGWAFPGGYINYGEDWKTAAAREAKEEIGLDINPKQIRLLEAVSTKSNFLVLFVGYSLPFQPKDWASFDMTKTNDKGEQEILDIKVIYRGEGCEGCDIGVHDRFWKKGISDPVG